MLSDNLLYLLLIAALGLGALVINHLLTTREQMRESRGKRLKWLKEQAEHTLNSLAILKEINCRTDIIDRLNQHALALIEEIAVLAPDSELMTEISKVKDSTDRTRPRQDAPKSDREVKKAQIYITFAEKLIIDMADKGKMTAHLARAYQQELYWLNICMVADAHNYQAQQLIEGKDSIGALSHLKHAKALLLKAMVPQRQKQERLRQVQSLIDQIQPKRDYGPGRLAESVDAYLSDQT